MVDDQRPPAQRRPLFQTSIRYGKMAHVGKFKTDREGLVRVRDRVVVRSERGREVGTVLVPLEPLPEGTALEGFGEIMRKASPEDLKQLDRIDKETRVHELQLAKDEVKKLSLPMKVVEVDHIMGGERVILYFVSESRVDFRELVRRLAHEFRTRIELKQVGARDHAKLVGDVGMCGLDVPCRTYLKELGGITMDMAKVQKHTADPSKITGVCGKLRCCLRFEYSAYVEARDLLPGRGVRVETRKGFGIVVDQNLLLREVTILPEGRDERVVVRHDEIVGVPKPVAGCAALPQIPPGVGRAPAAVAEPPKPAEPAIPLHEDTKVEMQAVVSEPPVASEWISVATMDELVEGKGKHVQAGVKQVALFKVGDRVYATEAACPHQGGPIADGTLEGLNVTCPWHKWCFDLATGESKSGPSRLLTYESKLENGQVFVKA